MKVTAHLLLDAKLLAQFSCGFRLRLSLLLAFALAVPTLAFADHGEAGAAVNGSWLTELLRYCLQKSTVVCSDFRSNDLWAAIYPDEIGCCCCQTQ